MDRSSTRRLILAALLLAGCDSNPEGPHAPSASSSTAPTVAPGAAGSATVAKKKVVNPREITSPD